MPIGACYARYARSPPPLKQNLGVQFMKQVKIKCPYCRARAQLRPAIAVRQDASPGEEVYLPLPGLRRLRQRPSRQSSPNGDAGG